MKHHDTELYILLLNHLQNYYSVPLLGHIAVLRTCSQLLHML